MSETAPGASNWSERLTRIARRIGSAIMNGCIYASHEGTYLHQILADDERQAKQLADEQEKAFTELESILSSSAGKLGFVEAAVIHEDIPR